jgi:uncharacterized protein DUF6600
MTRNAWAAVLTTLVLPLAPRAAEPYRPLPRMAADEVERRADEQPPPPPPAPAEVGVAAPGAAASRAERAPAPAPAAPTDDAGPLAPAEARELRDDPLPPVPSPLAAEPPGARQEAPATAARPPPPGTPRAPTLETFHAALSPFGTWERWSGYGWVWRPDVEADWRPYVHGQWIWNGRAWSWASDEPWGWATYHYGRWTYDPSAGWAWIPGLEWAPAWVTWRFDDAVVGWAPLFPGAGSWAAEHPSARLWTFVPRAKFRTGVPVARAAYAPRHFDVLWARFAGRGPRPAAQR